MKKIIFFMFVMIFLVGTISAFEFDNVKVYDEDKREYTITNALGLGEDIARVTLETPLNFIVPRGYQKVAEFTVENYDDYVNAFNDMEFYDLKNNNQEFTRDFDYKYKTIIQVPDYKTVCNEDILGNKTVIKTNCIQEQIGLKDKVSWEEINKETGLLKGNITIGIFTDVKKGDRVEWIPTLFGERLTEWSVWTESLNVDLISYYKLDGTSGIVIDSVGINNGTNIGAIRGLEGIINNSFNFTVNISNRVEVPYDDSLNITTDTISISYWIKPVSASTRGRVIGIDWPTGTYQVILPVTPVKPSLVLGNSTTEKGFSINYTVPPDIWTYVTHTFNGTEVRGYINGTLISTFSHTGNIKPNPTGNRGISIGAMFTNVWEGYNGQLDEIGLWNRSLSASEVSDLYNNGTGITYTNIFPELPIITLNSPVEAFTTTNQTINFNGTVTSPAVITNVTLFIDGVLNETNSSGINDTDYLFTKTITEGSYNWTYESCNINGCSTATTRTFTISNFIENTITFNAEVLETSFQSFELNITTIPSILSIDAFLNYNGTRNPSTSSCIGLNCTIANTIDIPLSILESENKTFFWEITAFDGSISVTTNTSNNEQNVSKIHIETCDATFTTQSLNFTTYDERNLSRVSPYSFDGTFDIWLGSGSIKRSNNFTNSSTTRELFCISPNATYFTDAQIDYNIGENSTFYTTRNYFLQNDTINNISQDIFLYLLETDIATSFILKVQDDNLLPLENHLIKIERFYPGENLFRIVQISKTSENGKTIGFFETETVDYRFIISKDALILLITSQQKIVGETAPFTLTFTIGENLGKPWKTLENLTDLQSSLVFNNSNGLVTYTYIDTSGNFSLGTLIVERENFSFATNTALCNMNSSQSSATIICNMSGNTTGTFIARGFVTRNTVETLIIQIIFIIQTFIDTVGFLGVLLAWFLILISSFAFKFNEIAGIFLVNATVIFVNIIGLVSFGMLAISALVAGSIIIVVVMEK